MIVALAKHLKTLPVRFKQSVSNAERLVEFLSQREEIAEVYYPGNNPIHLRQASTGGAVIGFRLKDESKAQAFVESPHYHLYRSVLVVLKPFFLTQQQCHMHCARSCKTRKRNYFRFIPLKCGT